MVSDEMRSRMEYALRQPEPGSALYELAKSLKAEQVPQRVIFDLFAEYQRKTAADDPLYDAIVDTMDLIYGGPWAKGHGLFDTELTNEDLA